MRRWILTTLVAACLFVSLFDPVIAGAESRSTDIIGTVPLRSSGPLTLLDANLNGQGPFSVAMDLGTTTTVIDLGLARQLELPVITPSDDAPDGGIGDGTIVRIERLSFGDLNLDAVRATVLDLELRWGEGAPKGVVGLESFGKFLVTLDLPARELSLATGELPHPDGREVLGYELEIHQDELGERRTPTVELRLADRKFAAELDPFAIGSLVLPEADVDIFPLTSAPGEIGRARTPDGEFPVLGASLEGSISVGGLTIDNPRVLFSTVFDHPVLGSGALDRFVVTFDAANQRVRIYTPAGRKDPLLAKAEALTPQSGEGEALKIAFNENSDNVRLMVLLSPT